MRKPFPLATLILFIFTMTGSMGCTRIGPGYVGIKVDMAGTDKGVEAYPARTGWLFYNIFSSNVLESPVFVQTVKWTKDPNEGHPSNEEITFTNKDSMLIAADISLSYSLRPEKVPAFYVKFRNDDLDAFTHGFLRNQARDVFNETAGKFSIEQIMGNNGPFLSEVRAQLQRLVEPVGVQIEQFGFIGAPRPPDPVVQSINAKVQATQLALQKQNEIMQAEAEAKKRVAQAQGEAQARVALAEGKATANRKLAESLTPNVIEWFRLKNQQASIEKWNGQRPMVEAGSSAGLLLNVPNPARTGQ